MRFDLSPASAMRRRTFSRAGVEDVGILAAQAERPLREQPPVLAQQRVLAPGLEVRSQLVLHPRQLGQVAVDLDQVDAQQVGPDRDVPGGDVAGGGPRLGDVFEELAQGCEVAHPEPLLGREVDARVQLGDEQVHHEGERQREEDADEGELPGVGQAIHDHHGGGQDPRGETFVVAAHPGQEARLCLHETDRRQSQGRTDVFERLPEGGDANGRGQIRSTRTSTAISSLPAPL